MVGLGAAAHRRVILLRFALAGVGREGADAQGLYPLGLAVQAQR
jgi:hypothetical protein